jgi:hypothetical protein
MSPLSTDARRVLDAARGAYDPDRSDRLRVRTALAATLPAAGAAAAGASAGGALKLVVFGVSVAVGSLGVLGGAGVVRAQKPAAPKGVAVAPRPAPVARAEPPPAPQPEPEPQPAAGVEEQRAHPAPVAAAPAPRVQRAREAPVHVAEPIAAPPPPMPRPAVQPAMAAVPSACAPEAELAVVQRATQGLHSAPLEALRQLDAYDERCSDGALVEERLATRAIALCLGQRGDDGRAALAKLEAKNPSSPALPRVREACGR